MTVLVHYREEVRSGSQAFSHVCRVRDLDLPPNLKTVTRCGVILCTCIDSTLYFCMGRDSMTGQITDFGGTYVNSKDQNPVKCALRELKEETLDTVILKTNNVKDSICVYNSSCLIIFYAVRPELLERYLSTFSANLTSTKTKVEVDMISCYTQQEIETMMCRKIVYDKVTNLLLPRIHHIFRILSSKCSDYCNVT